MLWCLGRHNPRLASTVRGQQGAATVAPPIVNCREAYPGYARQLPPTSFRLFLIPYIIYDASQQMFFIYIIIISNLGLWLELELLIFY